MTGWNNNKPSKLRCEAKMSAVGPQSFQDSQFQPFVKHQPCTLHRITLLVVLVQH
jgi:hypothetical protein